MNFCSKTFSETAEAEGDQGAARLDHFAMLRVFASIARLTRPPKTRFLARNRWVCGPRLLRDTLNKRQGLLFSTVYRWDIPTVSKTGQLT